MTDSSGGSTYTFQDSTVPTQTATVQAIPTNSVRLGFHFMPAGTELGQTSNQFKLYLDGKKVGTQAATTVPDDIALWNLKSLLKIKAQTLIICRQIGFQTRIFNRRRHNN